MLKNPKQQSFNNDNIITNQEIYTP